MTRSALPTIFSLLLLMLGAGAALADDPLARPSDPTARKHLEDGEAFYNQEKWDSAVVEFEKGALVAPELAVWYLALGQAHRQAGRYERARWYYERFLSKMDGNPEAEDVVAMVRKFIDDMAAAQSRLPSEAAPTQAPPLTTPARGSRFTTMRKIALGLGAGGVAAVGTGLVFGLRAQGFDQDADDLCPEPPCARAAEANALIDRGRTNARYANIAYGIGAVAVVGAAVLWFTGGPADDDAREPRSGAPGAAVGVKLSPVFKGFDVIMTF